MKPAVLEQWHRILETKNLAALDDLLADNATFLSPVVHTPQVGKAVTGLYLKSAAMMLTAGGTFRYVNEWWNEHSAVLEFEAEVNGILVNGVDMIFWNAEGKIDRFKVMIRPLKAINLVHEAMGRLLAAAKG
ncbi:MAG: nuclear transport factor 2 family protein [Pseudomonadota bacterium]